MKCLDAGFSGLICAMINMAEDARRLVEAASYAPLGGRSFGLTRANLVHGTGYARQANQKVLLLANIETREALSNLGAILTVEGIDGAYVGPSDLGLSRGYEPTLEPTAPEVIAAIAEIGRISRDKGRIAGVHTGSSAMVRAMLAQGFHFGSLLTDVRLFTNALAVSLAEVRNTNAGTTASY